MTPERLEIIKKLAALHDAVTSPVVSELIEELERVNLQVDGMKKFAGVLAQKIHDLCNHPRSIQFCESTVCQDHLERLGITEKLKHEEPHPPRAEGDLAPPGDAAGYAASASAPARLVSHCSGSACSNSWNRNCICICAKCEDAKARDH